MLQNILVAILLASLLITEGSSQAQCWTSSGCTGDTVPADDARDCCVGTNDGQSYGVGPLNCEVDQCIVHGFLNAIYDVVEDERLDTTFRLNVKGITNFPITIEGTITAMAGPTTSQADFESLMPISFENEAEIRLFTSNDEITLEYDDRVILSFTPDNPALIPGLEAAGEYVRDTATLNIIDNDRLLINFEESDYSIKEGGTLSTDIRFQFRNNQNPFSVRLCPVNISVVEDMGLGDFIDSGDIEIISRATTGADFSDQCTIMTVPAAETAGSQTYIIEKFFTVDDDDLNEVEQSFALTAEIGDDVPFNCFVEEVGSILDCSCFQTQDGDIDCFGDGRSGATEIRITDNDMMVIGFTERRRTVSEGLFPDSDEFPLEIDVATLRVSEREHQLLYRVLSSGTAIVVSLDFRDNLDYDARFGTVQADPIQQTYRLLPLRDSIPPLPTAIRNDFVPEDEECYSIQISPIDIPGLRELFMCDFVDTNSIPPMSFFCEHTICIANDDELFEVGFVKTAYTVSESVGSVEVCVELTKPTFDILDEFVVVEVTAFPPSVYIPANVTPWNYANPDVPNFLGLYPMAPMTDYAEQTVTFNAIDDETITELMRIVCYDQPIYEDMHLEGDEWLGLTLDVDRSSVLTTVRFMYDQAAIVIQDNDKAVVGLEQTFFCVSEGVGVVELCANVSSPVIDCPISCPFNVSLSTFNGTAVIPIDYVPLNAILTFAECETRRCVNVPIVDDLVDEPEENFFYTLERTPGLHPNISLDPTLGEIVIKDDDVLIEVGYDPITYRVNENQGSVKLTIRIFSPTPGGAPRPFTLHVTTQDDTAKSPDDYMNVSEIIEFNRGESSKTHTVIIRQDNLCENNPNELFFSNIIEVIGDPPIIVTQPQATVTIIDDPGDCEPDKKVNDTLTGDPLMTVPIQTEGDSIIYLCYEVHGEDDKYFNLISDTCVSVNAHYSKAAIASDNIVLNVVDEIGVRAVSSIGVSVNISVGLEDCKAYVNGVNVTTYNSDGIYVRTYKNRVRIAVPNGASSNNDLVMWVFCASGKTEDPVTWQFFNINFIRFVVVRGLNLAETSHGIIGQFWNVSVEVSEHAGLFNGANRNDAFDITVKHPDSDERSFVGLSYSVTWEFEKQECLYVGNSQAGKLGETVVPNDPVIEGTYHNYEVDSLFSPYFIFSRFDENNCF